MMTYKEDDITNMNENQLLEALDDDSVVQIKGSWGDALTFNVVNIKEYVWQELRFKSFRKKYGVLLK